MIDVNRTLLKIRKLMKERNWSVYRLAKEADIPYSSLNSLFQKNNQPTLSTLEKICDGFHISMSEFFQDCTPYRADTYQFASDELELINLYRELTGPDQKILLSYVKGFCKRAL